MKENMYAHTLTDQLIMEGSDYFLQFSTFQYKVYSMLEIVVSYWRLAAILCHFSLAKTGENKTRENSSGGWHNGK